MAFSSVRSINFSEKKRFLLFWICDSVALTQFCKLISFVFNSEVITVQKQTLFPIPNAQNFAQTSSVDRMPTAKTAGLYSLGDGDRYSRGGGGGGLFYVQIFFGIKYSLLLNILCLNIVGLNILWWLATLAARGVFYVQTFFGVKYSRVLNILGR